MANLIELADVTDFYPSADATKTNLLIAAITADVTRKLGFDPTYASATEKVRSCGGEYLDLPRYPLVSVDSITLIDGTTVVDSWEQYPAGDRWGRLRRTDDLEWPYTARSLSLVPYHARERAYVKVTYGAGFSLPGESPPEGTPELPADVKMEIVDWIGNRLTGRAAEIAAGGRYVQQQQMGSMKIQFGQGSKTRTADEIDQALVNSIVDKLKRKGPKC